jgi:hypothetical protein
VPERRRVFGKLYSCPICGAQTDNPIEVLPEGCGLKQHRCQPAKLRKARQEEMDQVDDEEPTYEDRLAEGFRLLDG